MLANNPLPAREFRHNYVRLVLMIITLLLFIGYITINECVEHFGHHNVSTNETFDAQQWLLYDVAPSYWVYRSLTALNYLWQIAWLLYSLTFIYRRSSNGYLYLSPNTLTLKFYIVFILAFVIPAVWIWFFQKHFAIWTWIIYLTSFLFLSLSLFIIGNNVSVNKKLYETGGFNRDMWCLRFFAQNGIAFFACWTAIQFVLTFDMFLQSYLSLLMVNAGTISLLMAAIIATAYYFGPNFNAALVEKCAYQFSPWIVFIFYFWGVVENSWTPKRIQRNTIIAIIELAASACAAVGALILFTVRHRTAKVEPVA